MKQDLNMSRYFDALEAFKAEHPDEVKKYWKSEKAFDKMVTQFRAKEKQMARDAIKLYGSLDRYMDEMISNLSHLTEVVDGLMDAVKNETGRESTLT